MPCFVGVSNRTPHSWKTPVTNCRTWARSCSSVTGCPRISKNWWFALSKHRRSSSRTNEGVRSASETLGAVYVLLIVRSPEVPADNGVIFEGEAFARPSKKGELNRHAPTVNRKAPRIEIRSSGYGPKEGRSWAMSPARRHGRGLIDGFRQLQWSSSSPLGDLLSPRP